MTDIADNPPTHLIIDSIHFHLSTSPFTSIPTLPCTLRACAILQGVYKRSLQGNASAENADLTLAFAKETAQLGT